MYKKLEKAIKSIREKTDFVPEVAIILGSGLGDFADQIEARTGIETKFARCGHIIRGGAPTLRDRLIATAMGYAAVQELLAGKSNEVMCIVDGKIQAVEINYALILDRMYKGRLQDGDLDQFTQEQLASMKETCRVRRCEIEYLYQMANSISF